MHITSDDLSLYFELGLNDNMMIKRDIAIKLYHRADWNKVNSTIRRRLLIMLGIIDYAAEKLQIVVNRETEICKKAKDIIKAKLNRLKQELKRDIKKEIYNNANAWK